MSIPVWEERGETQELREFLRTGVAGAEGSGRNETGAVTQPDHAKP